MVKNQWMLCDLQEISPGCLPPNLLSQVKTTLNGIYTLQMNFLIDIGTVGKFISTFINPLF